LEVGDQEVNCGIGEDEDEVADFGYDSQEVAEAEFDCLYLEVFGLLFVVDVALDEGVYEGGIDAFGFH
jgi:hypothetical protein